MAKLDTFSILFQNKKFLVATIPDIFSESNQYIYIGTHSLNEALYDNKKGYVDDIARLIDEKIYAYINDDFFTLCLEDFIANVRIYLD